jgi:peptide/nickel transport system substrate-binding protein
MSRPTETLRQSVVMSRRRLLSRAVVLGASLPASAALLAACGGDDEDPRTATATQADSTATATGIEPIATETMPQPTATSAAAEPTATTAEAEPTTTAEMAEPSPTDTALSYDYYGYEIEPAQNEGGIVIWATTFAIFGSLISEAAGYTGFFESLTEKHPETFEPMPFLAEGWEVSDDGTAWTLFIRPGVTWQDGMPLIAEDVLYSFDFWSKVRILDYLPPLGTETATAIDELTIELVFPTPAVNLPLDLATAYEIRPAHIWAEEIPIDGSTYETITGHPADTGADLSYLVSTSPFRIVEYVVDDHVTLERYDGYWRGAPHLDQLIYRQVGDAATFPAQLATGEIDLVGTNAESLDPAVTGEVEASGAVVVTAPGPWYTAVFPNQRPDTTPLFVDARVRQALLLAIDRQALVDVVMLGRGRIADAPYALTYAFDPDGITVDYPYDPEQAGMLLDEAGWLMGPDGVREKEGAPLSFTSYVRSGDTIMETTVSVVQEMWRLVGIEMQSQAEQSAAMFTRFAETFDYEMVFWAFNGSFPALAGCDANRVGYCNTEFDQLNADLAAELDPTVRRELTTDLLNLFMEDLPWAPLFYRDAIFAHTARLHNFIPSALNNRFNWNTWWVDG